MFLRQSRHDDDPHVRTVSNSLKVLVAATFPSSGDAHVGVRRTQNDRTMVIV